MSQFYQDSEKLEQDELRVKRKREKQLADIRTVTSTAEGRRLLWRIFSETGVFRTSFTGDNQTYFNEGRRDIGLFILTELFAAKPEVFMEMRAEHEADLAKEKLELKLAQTENSDF